MRNLCIILILTLAPAVLTAADFNAGMAAYERQDYSTAGREFSALAANGDPYAQYMLGRLHAQGHGVTQDYVEAHRWYNLAAARGHGHAAQARDTLAQRMSRAQIADAQRRAEQWQPGAAVATTDTQAMSSREVNGAIQSGLNELGYDAGPADGVMGGRTRAAIRDYQKDHAVRVDGQPSTSLLQHITGTLQTAATATETSGDTAWRKLVLHDRFGDGDYTRDPAWTVTAGQFAVAAGKGLRTVHVPRKPPPETRREDLPMAILGAILEQATGTASKAETDAPDFAEIHVDGAITNAFLMRLVLTMNEPATAPLAFGPYQGGDRVSGYRLVYTPDIDRGLHLVRLSASGSSVIESADADFVLNRQYAVRWSRNPSGEMIVSLDDKELLRVTDRSFSDAFSGFTLINRGGDYTLREIRIHGTY
ncbi:MAG: peptidoglycan-binding protein [Gammaproteobacteria bacterium]